MGIKVLHYGRAFWCYGCKAMRLEGQCRHTADLHLHPSGTKIRHAMIKKTKLPPEMIRPDILRLVSTMKKIFT